MQEHSGVLSVAWYEEEEQRLIQACKGRLMRDMTLVIEPQYHLVVPLPQFVGILITLSAHGGWSRCYLTTDNSLPVVLAQWSPGVVTIAYPLPYDCKSCIGYIEASPTTIAPDNNPGIPDIPDAGELGYAHRGRTEGVYLATEKTLFYTRGTLENRSITEGLSVWTYIGIVLVALVVIFALEVIHKRLRGVHPLIP